MNVCVLYNYCCSVFRVCLDLEEILDQRVPLESLVMLDRKVVKEIRDHPAHLELLVPKDLREAWV